MEPLEIKRKNIKLVKKNTKRQKNHTVIQPQWTAEEIDTDFKQFMRAKKPTAQITLPPELLEKCQGQESPTQTKGTKERAR